MKRWLWCGLLFYGLGGLVVCAIAAASLGLSSLSFAQSLQGYDRHDSDRQGYQQGRNDQELVSF